MSTAYRFEVDFDHEAGVWYVAESNLPGIHTEAETLDDLVAKLKSMVPDLLEAVADCGGAPDGSHAVPLEVILYTTTAESSAAA